METQTKINELRARCEEAGIPLTIHRIEIYKILLNSKEHPSPEMIYHNLKDTFPTLSLATVYNNLEALSRLRLVTKVNPISDQARYDGNISLHAHFVCLSCKSIEDIDPGTIDLSILPEMPDSDNVVYGKSLQFYGICKKCKKNTQEES